MAVMLRRLFVGCLALLSFVASAQTSNGTCTGRDWWAEGYGGYPAFVWTTPQGACDAYANSWDGTGGKDAYGVLNSMSAQSGFCRVDYVGGGTQINKALNSAASSCTVNPCVAGELTTANATVGWSRTASVSELDHVGPITFPTGTICDGQCQAEVTDNGKVAYKSVVPAANGLHRMSVDFTVRRTATQCTASAQDPFSKTATPLPCPGQVGEVNGKTVCVGTAAAPVPAPSGLSAARQTGQAAEIPGNPAAGPKPSTGEGSAPGGFGRTPAAGSGTAAGGPASAAGTPSTATGTVATPGTGQEQANCGAPGQPKCGIDETGTPTGKGATAEGEGILGQVNTQFGEKLNEYKQLQNPGWTWSFQLPTGCTPYNFGDAFNGLTINPCNWQTEIHAIMSILWIMTAVFACTRMVFQTLGKA